MSIFFRKSIFADFDDFYYKFLTIIYTNTAKHHVPSNIIKDDVDQRIDRRKNAGLNYLLRREIVDSLSHLDPKTEKNEAKMK